MSNGKRERSSGDYPGHKINYSTPQRIDHCNQTLSINEDTHPSFYLNEYINSTNIKVYSIQYRGSAFDRGTEFDMADIGTIV